MNDTTRHLLEVLAELNEDGILRDIYNVEDDNDAPLEVALRAWRDAGYPDAPKAGE